MHNFKELKVWQNARVLTKEIYFLSRQFPQEERFGLTAQMRGCAVSVTSNIAEGSGRGTNKDFSHFLNISIGSSCELETQLIIAFDLEFISSEELNNFTEKIQEIRKMLIGLQKKLVT